jgi:hypothetical protein
MSEETPATHTEHFLYQIEQAENRLNNLMKAFVSAGFEVDLEENSLVYTNGTYPSVKTKIRKAIK